MSLLISSRVSLKSDLEGFAGSLGKSLSEDATGVSDFASEV